MDFRNRSNTSFFKKSAKPEAPKEGRITRKQSHSKMEISLPPAPNTARNRSNTIIKDPTPPTVMHFVPLQSPLVAEADQNLSEIDKCLFAIKKEIYNIQMMNTEYETQLTKLTIYLTNANHVSTEMNIQTIVISKELSELSKQHIEYSKQILSLRQDLEKSYSQCSKYLTKNIEDETNEDLQQLKIPLQTQIEELNDLKSRINDFEEKNQNLKKKIANYAPQNQIKKNDDSMDEQIKNKKIDQFISQLRQQIIDLQLKKGEAKKLQKPKMNDLKAERSSLQKQNQQLTDYAEENHLLQKNIDDTKSKTHETIKRKDITFNTVQMLKKNMNDLSEENILLQKRKSFLELAKASD